MGYLLVSLSLKTLHCSISQKWILFARAEIYKCMPCSRTVGINLNVNLLIPLLLILSLSKGEMGKCHSVHPHNSMYSVQRLKNQESDNCEIYQRKVTWRKIRVWRDFKCRSEGWTHTCGTFLTSSLLGLKKTDGVVKSEGRSLLGERHGNRTKLGIFQVI